MWDPALFRKVGYGLGAASVGSFYLAHVHEFGHITPCVLTALTAGYWYIGLGDIQQKYHSLRRNFPVLAHIRYLFESIRPEIQQYFIESDHVQEPYSRAMRSIIYQRAKAQPDTRSLGTRKDVYKEGHMWVNHSMFPTNFDDIPNRVTVGSSQCSQPYSASLLNVSAMSYGALSGNAISALNLGAKMGGFYHNTGEGGISKYHLLGADIVWNVGTGYFACGRTNAQGEREFDPDQFAQNAVRPEIKMIEIKLSQGAKPSHGGILPAAKITETIADARGLGPPPWVDCNSPPRHSAFSTPKGLLLFVKQLRQLSGGKPIGVKLCVGRPEEFAALVHAMVKTGITLDFINVDGSEGGTGAAPSEFQDSIGMPLEEGLRLVNAMLTGASLRKEVSVICAGKVYNGFTIVKSLALGADLCNSARGMMFALGCIQALKCNSNKCPTGITTQDPHLESALDIDNKSKRVYNFHAQTVHSAMEILGAAGCKTPQEITPENVFVRHGGRHVRSLADFHGEYFPEIPEGALLNDSARGYLPKVPRAWWKMGGEMYHQSDTELGYIERNARPQAAAL